MLLKLAKPFSPQADLKKVCEDAEANPIAIADALDQASRREWRDWLPETLASYIGLAGHQVAQLDKVMAVQVALTNPDVFENWSLFNAVSTAFNHTQVNFDWVDPPSYMQLAWTCVCLHRLNQNHDALHPDLQKFVGICCMNSGVLYFPWSNPPIELPGNPLFQGLSTDDTVILAEMKKLIAGGMLENTKPSEVDEADPVEAQAAKLVAAQAYINAQKSDDPGEYV